MPRTNQFAILWDLQNTPCKKGNYPIEELLSCLKRYGSIYDGVVFNDFKGSDGSVLKQFEDAGLSTFTLTTRTANNADRKIIDYARKHLLLNSTITIVVLITSDGDFTSLVKQLQQAGKKVWVIYKNNLSQRLLLAADRLIHFNNLISGHSSAPVSSKPPFG